VLYEPVYCTMSTLGFAKHLSRSTLAKVATVPAGDKAPP